MIMITSSNGDIFPRYWPIVREIHRSPVNSHQKGQWRRALMFLWSSPEQIIETPVIRDAIALIMTSLWWIQIRWRCRSTAISLLPTALLQFLEIPRHHIYPGMSKKYRVDFNRILIKTRSYHHHIWIRLKLIHDDVNIWKQFPQSKWRGALMFSLICIWIHGWVNNR